MTIPSNLRVPFVTAEIGSSRASQDSGLIAYDALLMGQKLAAGSAATNTFHRVTNANAVIPLAGRGSQIHRMAVAWFLNNTGTSLTIAVIDDAGGATKAIDTITVTGTATAAGTVVLYIGGKRIAVAVASGDAFGAVAAAISAAITADLDLPITSAVALGVVTNTARNGGVAAGELDVRDSHLDGEALPAGIAIAYANGTPGATEPTLTTLIAAMGDTWYQIWAHPYTDATSLSAIEAELVIRFGPTKMIDGLAITAAAGSFSTLSSLGNTRNSQHSMICSQPGINPLTTSQEYAAAVAAKVALEAAVDPARPLQTVALAGVTAPHADDLFTLEERNLLLFEGIATTKVNAGQVQLERMITTYQTNPTGAADTAYLDVTTLLTLLFLRYSFRVRWMTRYPRHKLADDGVRVGAGQFIVTPAVGKAEAVGWFKDMERKGLVEGLAQFKADLTVVRDADPNRLNIVMSPDLINQLMVTAANIDFLL